MINYEQILINQKQTLLNTLIYRGCDIELAKDLYQDLFIKVKITLETGKYFEEGKFKYWLKVVIINMYISFLRKKNTRREQYFKYTQDRDGFFKALELETYADKNAIENDFLNKEEEFVKKYKNDILISKIFDAVNKLQQSQKKVLDLRYLNGLKYDEIAESLNISKNTALGIMRYAVINIKREIFAN